ncbi:MAG: hypothetical protein EA398_01920 [Deltaproteobacteria bacterium]|nr:MAG: hypothetical protein EA398_01920 [Deltaproteobacteria bacterium]
MSFPRTRYSPLTALCAAFALLAFGMGCSDSDDAEPRTFVPPGEESDSQARDVTGPGTGGVGDPDATGQPGTGEPGTGEPGTGEPGTGEPGDLPDDDGITISGTIPNYDGPGGTLGEFGRDIDVSSGDLEADGSFSVDLVSGAALAVELQPIAPGAAGSEGTRAFLCRNELLEVLPDDAMFFLHGRLLYNRTEPDGNIVVRTVELSTRTEGDSRSSNGLPNGYGDQYVMWLYSNQALAADVSCGDRVVDLDLQAGWNEIQVDFRSNGGERMVTGDRPDDVAWYIDPGF